MVRKSRKIRKLQISVNDTISAAGPLVLTDNCELKKEKYPLNSRGHRPDLRVIYGGFCTSEKDEELQIKYIEEEDSAALLQEGLTSSRTSLICYLARAMERKHIESMYRLGMVPDLEDSASNCESEEDQVEEEEVDQDAEAQKVGRTNEKVLVGFDIQEPYVLKSDDLTTSPKIVGKDEIGDDLALPGCEFN